MTIRRFAEWGRLIERPDIVVQCHSDVEVANIALEYRSRGEPIPHVYVTSGCLATSLGVSGSLSMAQVRELPIDLLRVSYRSASGNQLAATAANSVVLRHRFWNGEILAITNSGYWRSLEIAPKAHPNDGVCDVVEVSAGMSWRQRFIARRRIPLGTHIPHPAIVTRRCSSEWWMFTKPIGLYVDDVFVDLATRVQITVEADALNLLI